MSSIAHSIESIYAEMLKTSAEKSASVAAPAWDYEEHVRSNPELTELMKLASHYVQTYESDVSIDDVFALVYGMDKEANIRGTIAGGLRRLTGRGGSTVAQAAPTPAPALGPDLSFAENLRSTLKAPAGAKAAPDELSELADLSLQPQAKARAHKAMQGEAPPYTMRAQGPPPAAATAPKAAPPAATPQQPEFTPALTPAPPGKGPNIGPAPASSAPTKAPPDPSTSGPPPKKTAPAEPLDAGDVGDADIDLTKGRGWKLPAGLAAAGILGTGGGYTYGKNEAAEEATRNRNLAFGAGMATGVAAPRIISHAGQAMSNFGGQSAQPRYY